MEELKAMFRVCVANKKDGTRCNSPALKGGNFCFQHIGGSLREHTRARSIYNGPQLDFLYPGTRQAIQHNLYVVAQAMNDGKLELAQANTYNRIFSTCERNLRRFETQWEKSHSEVELLEVPDEPEESPEMPSKTPASNHPNTAPSTQQNPSAPSVSSVVNADDEAGAEQESLVSGHGFSHAESDTPEVEAGAPFKRSLSGEYDPILPEVTNIEPSLEPGNHNPVPEPRTPDPDDGPLVLTPEEREIFNQLEARYINDPSLADRIHHTYDQIRERRRANREKHPTVD